MASVTAVPMPSQQHLDWAVRAVALDATVVEAVGMHEGGSPWRLDIRTGDRVVQVVLRVADWGRIWGVAIATAAAGLEVAGAYELPTARLIASDVEGAETCECALLETFCAGTTTPSGPEALHSAGAALAQVHAIRMTPTKRLPLRLHHNPYDDYPAERRHGASLTSPLLDEADRILRKVSPPDGEPVFVHGDPWFGNMLWDDERCLGFIDWKACGVGHPGVDLGNLRLQASYQYGADGAAAITAGWQDAMGHPAEALAYWDAVAALNTPTDSGRSRDAFLEAALRGLS